MAAVRQGWGWAEPSLAAVHFLEDYELGVEVLEQKVLPYFLF